MGKKRILLVDDEKDLLEVVKIRLEANDYEVLVAYDGQQGFEKIQKENPDLVILDLMLPKMDGYKVCGLIKRDARYAKIPIIIFTARTQESDRETGKDMGADAYIAKPFEPEILLGTIRKLLENK